MRSLRLRQDDRRPCSDGPSGDKEGGNRYGSVDGGRRKKWEAAKDEKENTGARKSTRLSQPH